jgi:hypothetical protein
MKSARTILHKTSGLRRYLEQERATFVASPVLLIQSQPAVAAAGDDDKKHYNTAVDSACRHVQHLLQAANLRTVATAQTLKYAYPTASDIQHLTDLCRRVGASTVVGVGSGTAMDLAKAVVQSIGGRDISSSNRGRNAAAFEQLVLVPATATATMAAAMSHSLLLNAAEEALTVYPPDSQSLQEIPTVQVVLEPTLVDDSRQTKALYASLAIGLDCLTRDPTNELAITMIRNSLACLEFSDATEESHHELVQETLTTAGGLISYGLENDVRSVPMALAASLTPTLFTEHDIVAFMASLLPALVEQVDLASILGIADSSNLEKQLAAAPRIITTETLETLLTTVRDNHLLWNCIDDRNDGLTKALKEHLLVS